MSSRSSGLPFNGLEFHHVGVACRDIVAESELLQRFGAILDGPHFDDSGQGIRGQFLILGGHRLELLEDLPGSRTLEPWLRGPTRMYHQAFLSEGLDASLASMLAAGAQVAREPRHAVAFEGRRVAFVMLPGMSLVELIEATA